MKSFIKIFKFQVFLVLALVVSLANQAHAASCSDLRNAPGYGSGYEKMCQLICLFRYHGGISCYQ
jgi:hypothetical protein